MFSGKMGIDSLIELTQIEKSLNEKYLELWRFDEQNNRVKKEDESDESDESDNDNYSEADEAISKRQERNEIEDTIRQLEKSLHSNCRSRRSEEINQACNDFPASLCNMIIEYDGKGSDSKDEAKTVDAESIRRRNEYQNAVEESSEVREAYKHMADMAEEEKLSVEHMVNQHLQGLQEEIERAGEETAYYMAVFEKSQSSSQNTPSSPEVTQTEAAAIEVDSVGKPTYSSQSSSGFYSKTPKKRKGLSTNDDNKSDDKKNDDNSKPLSKKIKA